MNGSIDFDAGEDPEYRYTAHWYECGDDNFETLKDAQEWCQLEANRLVSDWAMISDERLNRLVRRGLADMTKEEEWARTTCGVFSMTANNIEVQRAALRALIEERDSLREHLLIERNAQAKKLDAINRAFNKLREAVSA